jgi:hypothetical protein
MDLEAASKPDKFFNCTKILTYSESTKRELAFMEDLIPLLQKQAEGDEISGLKAYQ